MSANRKIRRPNDKAEVGIGTLIVFIAMILVAAVAAAVLINTSGVLQQRALTTGKAASNDIASNLKVMEVQGSRENGTGSITNMTVYIQLMPGGLPVEVQKLWIHFADGASTSELTYHEENATTTTFTAAFPRYDGTLDTVLEQGEILRLDWKVSLTEREHARFTLSPEVGQQTLVEFYAPSSFSDLYDLDLV